MLIHSKIVLSLCLCACVFIGCKQDRSGLSELEAHKHEILQTEYAFADMANKAGIPAAFIAFAAEDAVLNRNNNLIKGKAAIQHYFDNQTLKNQSLSWKPDFIDVSMSGDLAYTYGSYQFSFVDSLGNSQTNEGIFHTVWKKQTDGKWKFVWD